MDTPFDSRIFVPLTEADQQQALAEAEAQVDAGQVFSLDKIVRWLRSWGTPDELPPPV